MTPGDGPGRSVVLPVTLEQFFRFLEDFGPIEKNIFWGIAAKRPTNQNKSTLGGPVSEKDPKHSTYVIPFYIDLHFYQKRAKTLISF